MAVAGGKSKQGNLWKLFLGAIGTSAISLNNWPASRLPSLIPGPTPPPKKKEERGAQVMSRLRNPP